MTTPRTLLLTLLATSAAALAAPSFAGAETICVHAPAGTACDGEQANLANAFQAAQGTFEPTTIALGESQTGPFAYPDGPVVAGDTVTGRRSIRLGRVRHGVVKISATDLAGNRSAARRVRS